MVVRGGSGSCCDVGVRVRCVVVGDDAVGKTSMLLGYATNRYPTQHVPSVFDNYAGTVKVAGRSLHLEIIDTLEEDESASCRLSEYPGTDIFVVCFSVVRPETLGHAEDVWLREIRAHGPSRTPFILVGTQADLREADAVVRGLRERGQVPVTEARGHDAARRLGAACYIECSPGVEKNLRRTINTAIASVLKVRPDPTLDSSPAAARGAPHAFGSRSSGSRHAGDPHCWDRAAARGHRRCQHQHHHQHHHRQHQTLQGAAAMCAIL